MPNKNRSDGEAGVQQGDVADAGEAGQARDLIVFLPGLAQDESRNIGFARRLVRAFEHNAATGAATFRLQDAKEEDFKETHRTRMVTLLRQDGEEARPVADIYALGYAQALTGAYRERTPAVQALSLAALLLANVGRLFRSIRRSSKTRGEKAQVAYACGVFILLSLYVVLLVVGLVGTVVETIRVQTGAAGVPAAAESGWWKALHWTQLGIVCSTALGLFTRRSLKELLAETASHLVPTLDYLDYDERKGLVLGQLNDLLDHLEEKGVPYRRVHVVSYSFGSVVALDALFPHQPPSPRLARVDTLTTIGSPFDFLRTYWPDYFTGRHSTPGHPSLWINVYAPLDVLGSDFRDTTDARPLRGVGLARDGERTPDRNVAFGREQKLSLLQYMSFMGFHAHAHYWERKETFDVNCFDLIVPTLFADHPALS